jgi:glucose-1-phosphate thymidylyltransferase
MIKAVIPVAGMGSNLRPHTHTQPKALVPVAGKPILAHIMDSLLEAGIQDFILIIGYLGDKIEKYVSGHYPDLKVEYVLQEPRLGLGHAIWMTRNFFAENHQMLIVLGDTIVNADLHSLIQSTHSVVGVKKVENPRLFGVAELDSDGFIKKLIEKPTIPKSNLALVGIYKIMNARKLLMALNYLIENDIKTQDEFHLTDGLMRILQEGEKITTSQVTNWYDCGKKETLLEANAILLHRLGFKEAHFPHFPDSIIVPPVSIGKDCIIKSSIIGPNVAIGDNSRIHSSIIQDSIVGSFAELENAVLRKSIIGNDSTLKGMTQSLNIGDNTEINLSN